MSTPERETWTSVRVPQRTREALELLRTELMDAGDDIPPGLREELRGKDGRGEAYSLGRVLTVAVDMARAYVGELRAAGDAAGTASPDDVGAVVRRAMGGGGTSATAAGPEAGGTDDPDGQAGDGGAKGP